VRASWAAFQQGRSKSLSDLVGKKLKDFYILRRLGRGAMAEVYLAQQLSLGRPVALKVLNEELGRDPAYVRRFHHEARAAAALVHANIVQIYEVGQSDGTHYIAQEYVPGRNLGEIIHNRGALEPRLALDILRQVAGALAKAAGEGIVHRDIKPENIMLSRSGDVKVADFGLARVQGDGAVNLTQVGVTMGTPLYMSPEQIEGRELDSRSDIYSLGVTAYHMLSGTPPFSGDSPLSVAVQHLNQPPEPLVKRRPDLPKNLAALVDRMLAKKPGARFENPSALIRELHQLAAEGATEGWAAKPDDWSLAEMIMVADDRAKATAQLEDLMKTGAMMRVRKWSPRAVAAAVFTCIVAGAAVAAVMARPRLLPDAPFGVPKYESALSQLHHAKLFDTAGAWQQAVEHENADFFTINLARRGLANYYLFNSRDYVKAEDPLLRLATLGDIDASFRAYGIAGLVVAYVHLQRYADANTQLSRISTADYTRFLDELQEMSPRLHDAFVTARETLIQADQ
jgi:serine/threonine-protein kinase